MKKTPRIRKLAPYIQASNRPEYCSVLFNNIFQLKQPSMIPLGIPVGLVVLWTLLSPLNVQASPALELRDPDSGTAASKDDNPTVYFNNSESCVGTAITC